MCDLSTPHPRASRRPRVRRRSFPILLVASLLALARARVSPDGSPDPLASEGEQLSRLRSSWGSAFDEIRSLGGRNATEEGVDNRHLAARMANVVRVKTPVPVIPAPAREGEAVLPDTDLGDPTKRIWIVTSASLPWMTGTAVNPLLRAAQLTRGRKGEGSVTLMLPWLEKASDRQRVYGNADKFSLPEEQEEDVRRWLRETAGMADAAERLRIRWYAAWLERAENSIYSTGDIIGTIPEEEVDICVLEEPEHLNWYRAPGDSWTSKFKHVIGIVHTNYFFYALEQPAAVLRAPAMKLLCSWMCRSHCHRIIKLSGTLAVFAPEKELVSNVHGVREGFLSAGKDLARALRSHDPRVAPTFGADAESPRVYFIGKMLWSKGIGTLIDLVEFAERNAGLKVAVDMYGGGPDREAAEKRAKEMNIHMTFHGPVDHVKLAETHKIFINPSTSEVLCTTVAEALAMGKFVIIPSHPSNEFFEQFPNCLNYSSEEEFVGNLYYAITHEPEPISEESSRTLSWEAATERFIAAGSVTVAEAEAMQKAYQETDQEIEINLPPIVKDAQQKHMISTRFKLVRQKYRQFRSKLAEEIMATTLLPLPLRESIVSELGNRLDVDIDELLESPTLRLQLSPAELDRKCLDIYKRVTTGTSGTLFRQIYRRTSSFMQPDDDNDDDDNTPVRGAGTLPGVTDILRKNKLFRATGVGGMGGGGSFLSINMLPGREEAGKEDVPRMSAAPPGGGGRRPPCRPAHRRSQTWWSPRGAGMAARRSRGMQLLL